MQIENDEKSKTMSRNSVGEAKSPSGNKTGRKKPSKATYGSKSDEFKRKYFEFYDDIKISDRQDW